MTVDWNTAKARYERGESARSIAVSMTDAGMQVSHTTINRRVKREGWKQRVTPCSALPEPVTHGTSAQRYLEASDSERHTPMLFNKDTPAIRADILIHLEQGMPDSIACGLTGISVDTLARWREADPEFAAEMAHARGICARRRIKRIEDAGKRGDWKADYQMLRHAPNTKDDFSEQGKESGKTINVVINVPTPIPMDVSQTIDAKATIEG